MFKFVRALIERLQARRADSYLDFEADLLARAAHRKAVLLRQADRLHDEGLHAVAEELRRRAEAICFAKPMSSLMPLAEKDGLVDTAALKPATGANSNHNRLPELTAKKKS